MNQVERLYNVLGQLTTEYQANGGVVDVSTTPKVQYGYSNLSGNRSRLQTMTYPNGKVLSYNYSGGLDPNDLSRLDSISDSTGTLESYEYLGLGTVVSRNHPVVNLSYITSSSGDAGDQYGGLDRFGRVVDQDWKNGSTVLDWHQYTYDRDGNRLTKSDGVSSGFGETYTYDGLNQIASYAQGSTHMQSWSYDGLGNWSSLNTDGTAVSRTHNAQNEVTGVGSAATAFDANGNMKTDETGKTYTYDAWNRMVSATNASTTATYSYDGLTRRVTETVGSTTTHLYYSAGWQVLEERLNSSTSASIQYVWSPVYIDALILRDRDTDANGSLDERLWPVQDANFNVTALVNDSGAVVEKFTYDAFGLAVVRDASYGVKSGGSDYSWVYRHQGGRWSSVSGLVSFRFREYSPTLGRWMTNDPSYNTMASGSLVVAYINTPTINTDPFGLFIINSGGSQREYPPNPRAHHFDRNVWIPNEDECHLLIAKWMDDLNAYVNHIEMLRSDVSHLMENRLSIFKHEVNFNSATTFLKFARTAKDKSFWQDAIKYDLKRIAEIKDENDVIISSINNTILALNALAYTIEILKDAIVSHCMHCLSNDQRHMLNYNVEYFGYPITPSVPNEDLPLYVPNDLGGEGLV